MLVDTFSQYGYGMFDALGAFFSFAPIGYGSFTLLLSALTALLFVAVYVVLRLSTQLADPRDRRARRRGRAQYLRPAGRLHVLPEHGSPALRSRLARDPAVCRGGSERAPRDACSTSSRWWWWGPSAAWSGETGVYCLGTACAIACLDAAALESGAWCSLPGGLPRCRQVPGREHVRSAPVHRAHAARRRARGPTGAHTLEFIRLYTTGGLGALPIGALVTRPGPRSVLRGVRGRADRRGRHCARRSSVSAVPRSGRSPV